MHHTEFLVFQQEKQFPLQGDGHPLSLGILVEIQQSYISEHYVVSVFLYNSELWTLIELVESTIDVFQRRHLRKILGTNSKNNIANENLHATTGCEPWN